MAPKNRNSMAYHDLANGEDDRLYRYQHNADQNVDKHMTGLVRRTIRLPLPEYRWKPLALAIEGEALKV